MTRRIVRIGLAITVLVVAVVLNVRPARSVTDGPNAPPTAEPKSVAAGAVPPKEEAAQKTFFEVGQSCDTHTGTDGVAGQCTTLTGFGMKELRVGLVVLKGKEETIIEERS